MQSLIRLTAKYEVGMNASGPESSHAILPSQGCELCCKCCKVLARDLTDRASVGLCNSSLSGNLIWLQFVKDHTRSSAVPPVSHFLPVTALLCWFWCRRWSWKPSYFGNTNTVRHTLLLISILRLCCKKNTCHSTSKSPVVQCWQKSSFCNKLEVSQQKMWCNHVDQHCSGRLYLSWNKSPVLQHLLLWVPGCCSHL